MARHPQHRIVAAVSLVVLFELAILAAALSIPLRSGATLSEAIAVLPQAVLWVIPLALALPILVAFAVRLGPRRTRKPDPDPDLFPVGYVTTFAETLRTAHAVQFARYRAVDTLIEAGTKIALGHSEEEPHEAWTRLEAEIARRDPAVASFLRYKDLRQMSGEEFVALMHRSVAVLEKYQEEA